MAIRIILWFLSLWLLSDMISGYFNHNGLKLFSVIFTILKLSLSLVLFYILLKNKNSLKWYLFILIPFVFLSILHVFISNGESVASTIFVFKITFVVLFYLSLNILFMKQYISFITLKYILFFNIFIISINCNLSYFGMGYSNYGITEEGAIIGGSGFFYAGNAVGGTMLALYALILYIYKDNLSYAIFFLVVFVTSGIGILSKTAIFGPLLLFFIYILIFHLTFIKSMFFISVFSLINLYYIEYIIGLVEQGVNRWLFFINSYGLDVFLLGGEKRLTHINETMNMFSDTPLYLFSGIGWYGKNENGFFDLLEAFGFFGLMLYLFLIIIIFKNISNGSRDALFISSSLFLIMFVSILSGHLVQSVMLAPFFSLLLLAYKYKFYEVGNENTNDK
jgi:hypothetical protein